MDEKLKQKVFSFLKSQKLGVIATASPTGKPEAAVVEYMVDENWNIYFFTHEDTRKIKNLKENNKVAIVVGTTLSLNTLQIDGTAEIIKSGTDHFEETLITFGHNETIFNIPLLKFKKLNLILVKIKTISARWLDFNEITGKEEYFEIIP